MTRGEPSPQMRLCRAVLPIAAGLAVVGLGACLPAPSAAPATAPPDVILITIDTLRADELGCYGGAAATPHIDRLARESLVFDAAIAPLPETRPSHYTLLTSLYPSDHGVLSNLFAPRPDLVTLPALYREAGYATAGFAGCALFDAEAGAELGFEHFDALPEGAEQRPSDQVVPAAIRWLERRDPERPFFLWLHLFDPHMPYLPPAPFNGRSAPEKVAALPDFTWPRLLAIAGENGGDLPAAVFERARDLYGGEVEFVDHWLGRLFETLRRENLYEDAVILLTADHGECFENGVFFDHSQCLGEGALAVPMILRYPPRIEPGRSAALVEHLDVAPTLLELSGIAVPEAFQGAGLLARGAGTEDPYAFFQHPIYRPLDVANRQEVLDQLRFVAGEPTREITGDRLLFGVRRGPWKYIRRGEEESLYNLRDDPAEKVDLSAREDEVLRELRHAAWRWRNEHPLELRDPGKLDPTLVENLQALGYL